MDLVEQMRTFVRVVDAGSLSSAARGRRLSLAAVSRQLGALEDDLGVALLVRTTRRLRITPAGERWYAHCTRFLRELDDARADVGERGEPRGSVVISAPITLGMSYVVPQLEQLARAHPKLELTLRLEDHVVDLVADGVDIAVRGGFALPDSTSIIAHEVVGYRRIAAAAPSYLARRGTPKHPRDLERHDAVVQQGVAAGFTGWRLERGGEVVDVKPRARLSSTAPMVLRDWAIAGAGIAVLPDWLVADSGKALRPLLDGWTTPMIRAWALHRTELRDSPRIRAVIAALSQPRRDWSIASQ